MTIISISAILAAQPSTYDVLYEGIEYQLNVGGSWVELSGTLTFSQSGNTTRMVIAGSNTTPIGIGWRARPAGTKTIESITASTTYVGGFGSAFLQVSGLPGTSGLFVDVGYLDGPDEDVAVSSITFMLEASSTSACPPQPSYPAQGQRLPWGSGPRNESSMNPGCPPIPVYPAQGQRLPWGWPP